MDRRAVEDRSRRHVLRLRLPCRLRDRRDAAQGGLRRALHGRWPLRVESEEGGGEAVRMMRRRITPVLVGGCLILLGVAGLARAEEAPPLTLDATIALPHTSGRIDHLAIDLARRHLFVAELGNGSVDVVDLVANRVLHRITGLKEPQGVGYAASAGRLAVASAGDGTVRLFSADSFASAGVISLGDDADNVRPAPDGRDVLV